MQDKDEPSRHLITGKLAGCNAEQFICNINSPTNLLSRSGERTADALSSADPFESARRGCTRRRVSGVERSGETTVTLETTNPEAAAWRSVVMSEVARSAGCSPAVQDRNTGRR